MIIKERLENIYWLGVKELFSLRYDVVMIFLIIYSFTYAVYSHAKNSRMELADASVAIVDEDQSQLSKRIHDALLKPYFLPPESLSLNEIDRAMDTGRYTFIIDIPPDFQADVLAGRRPTIQVNVDATAMSQASTGTSYIQNIISQEITKFVKGSDSRSDSPVNITIRVKFNPNLEPSWFSGLTEIINSITALAIFLTGAAVIRERERGTIEHLLVLPVRPFEIMLAKVWANGLIIVIVATLSLWFVVHRLLGVPIAGSIPLFVFGTVIYMFSATALGIFLATIVRSMPQFGLLAFLVFIVMNLLSGGLTPLDSMPKLLQHIMQFSPSTHFVSFAQAILFRGAGFSIVWPDFAAVAAIGMVLFTMALLRFRRTITMTQT